MALDEQDKLWIVEQLERFATREQLEKLETRLLTELHRQSEELETRLLTQLHRQLERFATKEQLEKVETTLLTEFHKWASPAEARQNAIRSALKAIGAEMEYLSDRVKKIEEGQRPPQ